MTIDYQHIYYDTLNLVIAGKIKNKRKLYDYIREKLNFATEKASILIIDALMDNCVLSSNSSFEWLFIQ